MYVAFSKLTALKCNTIISHKMNWLLIIKLIIVRILNQFLYFFVYSGGSLLIFHQHHKLKSGAEGEEEIGDFQVPG